MRRLLALLTIPLLALAAPACRPQPEGSVKVTVIGDEPRMRDPAQGALDASDALLVANVAQGLVRFDAGGNIVAGLAERWNLSDDGLSYVFRLAKTEWPDGRKVTAQQIAKLLKRATSPRSRNSLSDTLGAVQDVVAMTDRVIEIRLNAPRPNLLALLAQPEMAVVRNGEGTGPFTLSTKGKSKDELRLVRKLVTEDEEVSQKEEVLLSSADAEKSVQAFAAGTTDLVLGGTFGDLPYARRAKLPRNSLRFDPASGLFGLVPVRSGGPLDDPEARRLLAQAIDRENFVATMGVPGLSPRATLLEPGLDGVPDPVAPAWTGTPAAQRREGLVAQANRMFGTIKPTIRVALPDTPGGAVLFDELQRDWSALGFSVERATSGAPADFRLVDSVAPSSSPAWFVRQFRCDVMPVCDKEIDELIDAARESPIPAQRYALIAQAAGRIDAAQMFIPLTAPIRWSLVSQRLRGFAGNRFARHTLTDLEQRPGSN
jgi:oligopeptide transport system substrate-binding protein